VFDTWKSKLAERIALPGGRRAVGALEVSAPGLRRGRDGAVGAVLSHAHGENLGAHQRQWRSARRAASMGGSPPLPRLRGCGRYLEPAPARGLHGGPIRVQCRERGGRGRRQPLVRRQSGGVVVLFLLFGGTAILTSLAGLRGVAAATPGSPAAATSTATAATVAAASLPVKGPTGCDVTRGVRLTIVG